MRCVRLAVLGGALLPGPALAHSAVAGADSFTAGLLHPFVVPAHLLAVVGLGLLLAQRDFARASGAVYLFIAGLIAGLAAAGAGWSSPAVQPALLAVAALLGLLTALAWPRLAGAAAPLALAAALAVGLDSAPASGPLEARVASLLGTGLAALLLLLNVVALGLWLARPWQRIGQRVLGSWIAASALLVLALGLRG